MGADYTRYGGAEELAQQLRELAALSKDPSSVPSAHIGWFTRACNSSFKASNTLFWLPVHPPTHTHTHALISVHIYTQKKINPNQTGSKHDLGEVWGQLEKGRERVQAEV